jgi:hypothetical protein
MRAFAFSIGCSVSAWVTISPGSPTHATKSLAALKMHTLAPCRR